MHINHSLNCTILNLQFVPVRRLYKLKVNRFSKTGTSSSFTANLSRPNTGQLGISKKNIRAQRGSTAEAWPISTQTACQNYKLRFKRKSDSEGKPG